MTSPPRTARILLVDDNANDVELTLDAFSEVHLGNHIDAGPPRPDDDGEAPA